MGWQTAARGPNAVLKAITCGLKVTFQLKTYRFKNSYKKKTVVKAYNSCFNLIITRY